MPQEDLENEDAQRLGREFDRVLDDHASTIGAAIGEALKHETLSNVVVWLADPNHEPARLLFRHFHEAPGGPSFETYEAAVRSDAARRHVRPMFIRVLPRVRAAELADEVASSVAVALASPPPGINTVWCVANFDAALLCKPRRFVALTTTQRGSA